MTYFILSNSGEGKFIIIKEGGKNTLVFERENKRYEINISKKTFNKLFNFSIGKNFKEIIKNSNDSFKKEKKVEMVIVHEVFCRTNY